MKNSKTLLKISSLFAVVVGIILVLGSIWAVIFTYTNVARENIITPEDASMPGVPVRGPLTLMSQANIIREHTLRLTGGKTFAQMPRQIAKLDENGSPVLDSNGDPVMVNNTVRDLWITATTLITALNLGIITYAFSGFIFLFGLISIWTGIIFYILSKKY